MCIDTQVLLWLMKPNIHYELNLKAQMSNNNKNIIIIWLYLTTAAAGNYGRLANFRHQKHFSGDLQQTKLSRPK